MIKYISFNNPTFVVFLFIFLQLTGSHNMHPNENNSSALYIFGSCFLMYQLLQSHIHGRRWEKRIHHSGMYIKKKCMNRKYHKTGGLSTPRVCFRVRVCYLPSCTSAPSSSWPWWFIRNPPCSSLRNTLVFIFWPLVSSRLKSQINWWWVSDLSCVCSSRVRRV